MNWTIIWLDGPLEQLAAATSTTWGTPMSDAIVRAMVQVDRLLETDPLQAGESVPATGESSWSGRSRWSARSTSISGRSS